jgi:hypothetical protein
MFPSSDEAARRDHAAQLAAEGIRKFEKHVAARDPPESQER